MLLPYLAVGLSDDAALRVTKLAKFVTPHLRPFRLTVPALSTGSGQLSSGRIIVIASVAKQSR